MTKLGNCFHNSALIVLGWAGQELVPTAATDVELVHGIATGQGALAGQRYRHGWVEFDLADGPDARCCLDVTHGFEMDGDDEARILPRAVYYKAGSIKEEECRRYNRARVNAMIIKHERWGSWDPSFENLP